MASLFPCKIKTHYSWAFGTIYGPTTYGDDNVFFDCFCGYTTIEDDGGDEGFNLVFPVNVGCVTYAKFQITGTRGGAVSDRVIVKCDSTEKYNSGCGSTDFDSGVIYIPAGTQNMTVEVQALCSGGTGTYWSFYLGVSCV
jgi:hypothetical protein